MLLGKLGFEVVIVIIYFKPRLLMEKKQYKKLKKQNHVVKNVNYLISF